jgi:hypothetical protein
MIHTHDRDADRVPSALAELGYLIAKVIDHTVDLFDHRFREYLDFGSNFHSRHRPSRNDIAGVADRRFSWDDFTESPIATPSRDSATFVLDIEDPLVCPHRRDQLRRPGDRYKVLVEMHGYVVPQAGIAMTVDFPFKEPLKFGQQTVFSQSPPRRESRRTSAPDNRPPAGGGGQSPGRWDRSQR